MIFRIGTSHRYFVLLPRFGYRSHSTWHILNGIANLYLIVMRRKTVMLTPFLAHYNNKVKHQNEASTISSNVETYPRNVLFLCRFFAMVSSSSCGLTVYFCFPSRTYMQMIRDMKTNLYFKS
jgi:hypothetical protein